MQYTNRLCRELIEPLTTLHGNLEFLQDENVILMESKRFHDILHDVDEITNVLRKIQKRPILLAD